jgi:hypothetical protein
MGQRRHSFDPNLFQQLGIGKLAIGAKLWIHVPIEW